MVMHTNAGTPKKMAIRTLKPGSSRSVLVDLTTSCPNGCFRSEGNQWEANILPSTPLAHKTNIRNPNTIKRMGKVPLRGLILFRLLCINTYAQRPIIRNKFPTVIQYPILLSWIALGSDMITIFHMATYQPRSSFLNEFFKNILVNLMNWIIFSTNSPACNNRILAWV